MVKTNSWSNQKIGDVRRIADFKSLKKDNNRNSTNIKVPKKP